MNEKLSKVLKVCMEILVYILMAAIMIALALWALLAIGNRIAHADVDDQGPASIMQAATASAPAVRLTPPTTTTIPAFATDCDEMSWYRTQWGLPEVFDRIGWRESNCRNEDGVRTFCCYGWWQNYISSHLSSQSLYRDRIIDECGVTSYRDINSDTPEDKWRQACVTWVVYSVERSLGRSGTGPWQ
jgi:hypothetical protein